MRILIIECDAEELRANRTVMDNITEVLSSFTRALVGSDVSTDAVASALSKKIEEEYADDPDDNQQGEAGND